MAVSYKRVENKTKAVKKKTKASKAKRNRGWETGTYDTIWGKGNLRGTAGVPAKRAEKNRNPFKDVTHNQSLLAGIMSRW